MITQTTRPEPIWQLFVDGELIAADLQEHEMLEKARLHSESGKTVTRELWNGKIIREEFSPEYDRFVRLI